VTHEHIPLQPAPILRHAHCVVVQPFVQAQLARC